jgi:hypothetical protein
LVQGNEFGKGQVDPASGGTAAVGEEDGVAVVGLMEVAGLGFDVLYEVGLVLMVVRLGVCGV